MPQNLIRLRSGTSIVPDPPDIIGSDKDGCEGGRLLRGVFSGLQGRDAGGPAIPHHIQRGVGCGGVTLGCSDVGERGRAERARTRGKIPKFRLLRR